MCTEFLLATPQEIVVSHYPPPLFFF
uniref:Uncharacterized protein n=1 Tax=Anguilla anguilla TaxID=7936 RepID=A0A0E9QR96_ANGAN